MNINYKILGCMFLIIVSQACRKDGTCDFSVSAEFRGFRFAFPLKADELMQRPEKKTYLPGTYVLFDSVQGSPLIYCFMEHAENNFNISDSVNFIKDAYIYGISFKLFKEYDRNDQNFIDELTQLYPGEYKKIYRFGNAYYLNHQPCMSIIFRRDYYGTQAIPVVSFVYGLSDDAEHYYAMKTGSNTLPD